MASSSGGGTDYSSVYVFLGVLLLLVIRRFSRVIRGSRVSKARTVVYIAYYLGFAGLLIAVSVVAGGVAPIDLALYALVGVLGAFGAYHFSNTRIGFWKGGDGAIYFRGALLVYIIYVVGLVTRIAIDLAFIGPQAFTFSVGGPAPTLSATAIDAGIATDILLALGSGLLTGRNLRVLHRYGMIMSGREEVGDTPPKITLV